MQAIHERGIQRPEIICSYSAHGALDKACHYFNLKLVKVEANPDTLTLDVGLVIVYLLYIRTCPFLPLMLNFNGAAC